jgi:hypothetical protein
MFRAVPPPIIRSSKLYTQHRVFVKLFLLLTALVSELERSSNSLTRALLFLMECGGIIGPHVEQQQQRRLNICSLSQFNKGIRRIFGGKILYRDCCYSLATEKQVL